ncbi:MAG TPA: hypothetical protein VEC12_00320 [Bacteroidia bacterium]|nr:hypothetical protein [Bacteroidia bacterium]
MDFLIYNKINDPEIKKGLAEILAGIGDPVFSNPDIIIINNKIPESIVKYLQGFLHDKDLDIDDIIYIFYPQNDTKFGMWPLKRQGRKKVHPTLTNFGKWPD